MQSSVILFLIFLPVRRTSTLEQNTTEAQDKREDFYEHKEFSSECMLPVPEKEKNLGLIHIWSLTACIEMPVFVTVTKLFKLSVSVLSFL